MYISNIYVIPFHTVPAEPMSIDTLAAAFKTSPQYQKVLDALPTVRAPPVTYQAPEADLAFSRCAQQEQAL